MIAQGKTHFFTRPDVVWDWLDMWDSVPVQTLTSKDPFFIRADDVNRGRGRATRRSRGKGREDRRFVVCADGTIDTVEKDSLPDSVLVPDKALEEDRTQLDQQEEAIQKTMVVPETLKT